VPISTAFRGLFYFDTLTRMIDISNDSQPNSDAIDKAAESIAALLIQFIEEKYARRKKRERKPANL